MIAIRDGHRHKGSSGCLVTITEYEGAGWGREPSGHIFEQVRYKRFERWFHPYDGSSPSKL